MKKTTLETNEVISFDPPEWKQVSLNPAIFEAQKDDVILKVQDFKKSNDIVHSCYTVIFNKGEQVEVSIIGKKFRLSYDEHIMRVGEKMDFDGET